MKRIKITLLVIFFVSGLLTAQFQSASDSAIAYWKFDEESWNGTEGEVIDETGSYNGTTVNGTTITDGIKGNAGLFDGIDDYISIGTGLSPSGDFSLSAWFLDNGVTISQQWYNDYIISKGNDLAGTHNSWGLHAWDQNLGDSLYGCGFMSVTDQELHWTATTTENIERGKWYNIVGVISSDTSYLYVNGLLVNKEHIQGSIQQSNLTVNIGKMERAGCEYFFHGKIDEVKVYDRSLTSEEIKDEYLQNREEFEITNVVISDINSTQAEISWNTNYPARGFIFYAENDTTSGFPIEAMEPNELITEHTMILENLTPNSTYYFIIDQRDIFMQNVRSATFSFTTDNNNAGNSFVDSLNTLHKLASVFDEENSSYYDGAFISKDIAYIVTSHNRLFKTIDGGSTWSDISPEQGTSFDSVGNTPRVSFINENIGAVAFSVDDGANGYDTDKTFGYVWCTTDGGETWSERFDVNEDQILHLKQASETVTYVSGAAHLGVSSTRWFKKITRNPADNNYTVTDIATTPTSRPHVMSGDWLNAENGSILGKLNYGDYTLEVFKTTDGGNSWNSIQSNLPTMTNSSISFSDRGIRMVDENRIVFATYSTIYSNRDASIYYTVDGGTSWTKSTIPDSPVSLTSLSFDAIGENGIVCGNSSTDSSKVFYISTDYAQNWEAFLLPEISIPITLFAGEITSDGSIWIIGSNQSIWKSGHLTGIETNDENTPPTDFLLSQNYPNPFNPSTIINFQIPKNGFVTMKVYDILGKEIATLVNEVHQAGNYKVTFDATNLPAGIYFYRLQSGGFVKTKKMILLK